MESNEVKRDGDGQACLVCGGRRFAPFLAGCRDRYLGSGRIVDYCRCEDCGLVQQWPLPSDIASLYEDYPVHRPKSRAYTLLRRALMSGVYLDPATWPPGTTLLDYGCGDGWYLEWCRERGLQAIGFEPGEALAAASTARLGLPVYARPDELLARHAGSCDVVTLHFVVEHLPEIEPVLASARALLKPGGVVRYVVPHIDSWEFRLFGRRWHSLDPPRHISFPDRRHALRFAAALDMELVGDDAVAFPNGFGGSLPTALTGRFRAALFFALLPLALPVTRLFPGGNRAYWLRRRS